MENKPFLYYSNYCKHCQGMIQSISTTSLKQNIHFINIDNRIKNASGMFIQLNENTVLPFPKCIERVPSLLFLKQNKVLVGNDINDYIFDQLRSDKINTTNHEPNPFLFSGHSCRFVHSDNYSFLDQDSTEMSAKGTGGLRQMYNYATYDFMDKIDTPTDDENYTMNMKNINLEELKKERDKEISSTVQPTPSILPR